MELIDIQIGNPNYLWLLTVVVTCLLVTVYAILARQRSARKFTTTSSPKKISRSTAKHWVSSLLITASLTLLTIGLMDIRWGKTTREVPQKGIEVMFVLDVSRSMLAQDASPNRLSRAKQQIKDMIDEMVGDRVGLLVFAGETRQSVPLTSHYEDFKQTLDMVGPQSVRVGGSRLGDAITAAANGFISKTNDHKAIVIFTDGEDQESEPVEIAKKLFAEQGIRIFTVGLGDMDQGARIPNQDSRGQNFVEYEGQQVWSKMNGQILKAIATETNGAYIPAGTKRVDMANVYHGYLANVEQAEFETAKIDAYIPRFQWFALPALCLLALEVLISTKRKRKHQTPVVDLVKDPYSQKRVVDLVKDPISQNEGSLTRSTTKRKSSKQHAHLTAIFTTLLLFPATTTNAPANGGNVAQLINKANQELRAGNYDAAIEQYQQLVRTPQQQSLIDYNLAVAYYRNGDLQAARNLFSETAISENNQIAADSRYNLGNCQYALALEQSEQNAKTAISMLQDAIINYRSSLRIDPDNPDARANIELAIELLKRLEQQEQERENQQNQDQQDQSRENQEEEQSQQQKQEDNEQSQAPDNSESPPDSKDQPQENSEQQSQEQSQGNDSDPSQQQQDNSQNQSESDSRKDQRNDGQNQQQADSDEQSDDGEGQEQTEKNQDQPVPSGQLSTADQDESEQSESGSSVVQQNPDQGLMTKEEALKMLQAVRDRDMLRRLRQERQERARQVPVEKDW